MIKNRGQENRRKNEARKGATTIAQRILGMPFSKESSLSRYSCSLLEDSRYLRKACAFKRNERFRPRNGWTTGREDEDGGVDTVAVLMPVTVRLAFGK